MYLVTKNIYYKLYMVIDKQEQYMIIKNPARKEGVFIKKRVAVTPQAAGYQPRSFAMKAEERCDYRIINLAYACPLCIDNPHCPLKDIRTRQFNEKIAWFNSLSSSTKWTIHNYHFRCYLKHKEKQDDIYREAFPE
ncbi:MAG: hypothetical protein D3906_02665, partial [Candidatus Electrothrix sp. AUS1_2]|nr:hypothetical protein [Candidatus Electrothrix sp. AUS1_2]